MAEALFNKLAAGRARAVSAGTEPDRAIDPTVVKVMREIGIDINQREPKKLTPEMIEQANKVITMGCGVEGVCPATFVETEDWELEDPRGKKLEKVREIRNQIQDKVVVLLKNMIRKTVNTNSE